MKSIEELGGLMVELIEAVEEASKGGEELIFTPRAVEIVKEIAAYSKTTKVYQQQAQRAADFWAEPHTPADVWLFMLDRIVNAPLRVIPGRGGFVAHAGLGKGHRGGAEMKALTIWQPWAELIIKGHKTMETRVWKPYYSDRRIAIHAAAYKRLPHEIYMEIAAAIGIPPEEYNGTWLYYMEHHVPAQSFGVVIGTATIGRVLTSSEAIKVISPKERALGDYSPRRYAWELTDVEVFKKPIPARGQQGLWEWDGYEEAQR